MIILLRTLDILLLTLAFLVNLVVLILAIEDYAVVRDRKANGILGRVSFSLVRRKAIRMFIIIFLLTISIISIFQGQQPTPERWRRQVAGLAIFLILPILFCIDTISDYRDRLHIMSFIRKHDPGELE